MIRSTILTTILLASIPAAETAASAVPDQACLEARAVAQEIETRIGEYDAFGWTVAGAEADCAGRVIAYRVAMAEPLQAWQAESWAERVCAGEGWPRITLPAGWSASLVYNGEAVRSACGEPQTVES